MRRSRSGVRSMKRPIGSFLFIGPTGVGKTETAKTLADVFFGNEAQMQRIDMSEYRGVDALERLIGSQTTGQVGTLTKIIKENPYGVLLLDEFEKTNPNIHDLFLQILDEGYYSDMRGKKVNARNIIFIATSNAGSELIWEYMDKGVNLVDAKDDIVNHLINTGKFKPEFLNRFDAVVLFHPLELEHIEKIAGLMLVGLAKRLKKRGLDLQTTPELVKFIAKKGYDRVFGARPMTRYIQENIEQLIADKIIKGEIVQGTHFTLSPEDLSTIPVQPEAFEEVGREQAPVIDKINAPSTVAQPVAQQVPPTQAVGQPTNQPMVNPPPVQQVPIQPTAPVASPQPVVQEAVPVQPIITQPVPIQNIPTQPPAPIATEAPPVTPQQPPQPEQQVNVQTTAPAPLLQPTPTVAPVNTAQTTPPVTPPQTKNKPIEIATIKSRGPQFESQKPG